MGLDNETRQLLLRAILDYQRCFTLLAAYDAQLRTEFGTDWLFAFRNKVEGLIEHPAAKEAASQHFAHLVEVTLEGLDQHSAQQLLNAVSTPRLQ
jgi:hypothetical protein